MASTIREYLADIENQLRPTLDEKELEAILTETEVHLRERVAEFQEIGLDPRVAELRAVEAFGDCDEFVDEIAHEIPTRPYTKPTPRVDPEPEIGNRKTRNHALEWVWFCGGIALLMNMANLRSFLPQEIMLLIACVGMFLFAMAGKTISYRFLGRTIGIGAGLFTVILSIWFVFPDGFNRPMHASNAQKVVSMLETEIIPSYARRIERHITLSSLERKGTLPKNDAGDYIVPQTADFLDRQNSGRQQLFANLVSDNYPVNLNQWYEGDYLPAVTFVDKPGNDGSTTRTTAAMAPEDISLRWTIDSQPYFNYLTNSKSRAEEVLSKIQGSSQFSLGRIFSAMAYALCAGMVAFASIAVAQIAGSLAGAFFGSLFGAFGRRVPRESDQNNSNYQSYSRQSEL